MMLEFSGTVLMKKISVQENPRKYDFSGMAIGQSMFDPGVKSTVSSRIRAAAAKYGAKVGKKFTAKQEPDGVRITRTV
jgi:hypothetical protein